MISCHNTVVLLALLASPLLLPSVASLSAAAVVVDSTYNGICDVDICTCLTYDGTPCPDWMRGRIFGNGGGYYESSGSLSFGNATDDDAGVQSYLACAAYGTKLSESWSIYYDWYEVPSDQTESPMQFRNGISLEFWSLVGAAGCENAENSTVLVNYTASDPAPDCSTVTPPPAQWSSSSEQKISTLRRSLVTASGSAIVAVVATFL